MTQDPAGQSQPPFSLPDVSDILPNDVMRHYAGSVSLSIRMLDRSDDSGPPSILIEGDKRTLEFVASLILAVAHDEDCGFGIQPQGPGDAVFDPSSQYGIYVHRLPCVNEELKRRGSS
jgi:hypothetical protein